MADVIASINTAIASACTSHPSPVSSGDIPSLSYDGVLFFIQSTTNFRDLTTGYELGFNEHLFALFHTFPRIPADTVQNPYFLLDGDLVQQPESTLEAIIPVKRIEI